MDKKSTHEILLGNALEDLKGKIPNKYSSIVIQFIECYRQAVEREFDKAVPNLLLFLQLVETQLKAPCSFEPYHRKIRHPIDYYRFSLDFIRPLIDMSRSFVLGLEHLNETARALKAGENAILLANHQTEPIPRPSRSFWKKRIRRSRKKSSTSQESG